MEEAIKKLGETATTAEEGEKFARESEDFLKLFHRYTELRRTPGGEYIDWDAAVKPPTPGMVVDHSTLSRSVGAAEAKALLSKLVVVKLNGGLGTTMGCTGPKSVIDAHGGKTFLDLAVEQLACLNRAHGVDVPLVLMNSFNTHRECGKIVPKYANSGVRVMSFMQSKHPRFDQDTLLPVAASLSAPDSDFYPPGHADFYASFAASGLLERFASEGKEIVFVSNVDNLGATVDLSILGHVVAEKLDFAMEVTPKTRADIKGGTLIATPDGRPKLLEIAQVPPAHTKDFTSISTFKIFNTNNMWIRMSSIPPLVQSGKLLSAIDVIVNRKPYGSQTVVQLETAAGAAIQFFDRARGICVPRSRFLPVKGTTDLLLLQSNLLVLQDGMLSLNPARERLVGTCALPAVHLGPEFRKVGDFLKRFGSIPDIVELESLTVQGDVTFGRSCTLKGNVVVVAPPGCHVDIPAGSVLDNKFVQGNLVISDVI